MSKKLETKMAMSDYRGHENTSASELKFALKSAATYKAYKDGKIIFKSTALDVGTAAHAAILEQDYSQYVEGPDVKTKASKEWKAFVAENEDKVVLKPDEMTMIKEMFSGFFSHKIAKKVINGGNPEVSLFAEGFKARFDYFVQSEEGDYIVDYKTAQSADPKDFQRSVFKYDYDLSAAHYMNMAERVTGKRPLDFIWIVQEKTAPYLVNVFKISEQVLQNGQAKIAIAMKNINEAKESGIYKGYSEEITEIDLPSWASVREEY